MYLRPKVKVTPLSHHSKKLCSLCIILLEVAAIRDLYIQKRCMYEEYRYIYYFLPNVIANAQSGQDELTSCRCWSKASGKSWLCCSNTGFAIYLFSFLPSYEWASKQDPIDLSVKQSLIRGQYHHYHHHQSKSCLPWPSTITLRVASCSFLLVHLLLLLLVGTW